MSTKSHTLIPHQLQDHNVQSWKSCFFPCAKREQQSFEGPKNHFFALWILTVLMHIKEDWVSYLYWKNHIQKSCGRLPKNLFSARGYTEIHKQMPFFDNKNSIWKKFNQKSERWEHALLLSLYIEIFIFEKYQNLNFWWNFKVSSLGRFW